MTKFLIIRLSSIGDIVLTTPVIRCLKTQFQGNCEVHYLCKSNYKDLLKSNPYLDKIHTIDRTISEFYETLKQEQYDFIIDLHHNLRTSILKLKSGATSYSFPKLNVEKWLLVNLKVDKLPEVHIVERYLSTISTFNIKNDAEGLDYFVEESDFNNLPKSAQNIMLGEYHVLSLGGSFETKKLPKEMLLDLCNRVKGSLVLIGGKEDEKVGKYIEVKTEKNVVNLCGSLTVRESAAVISKSKTVITHDTGMMHIASALKRKVISVWGNTIPEFGMTPYLPEDGSKIFEVKDLRCRPCSKLGDNKCPKKHFHCMNLQDIDAIAETVNSTGL